LEVILDFQERKKEEKEMEKGTKKERYQFIIHMIVCLE